MIKYATLQKIIPLRIQIKKFDELKTELHIIITFFYPFHFM